MRSRTARAAPAARSRIIASTGPGSPGRSSASTAEPSGTRSVRIQAWSAAAGSGAALPAASTRTCTRRPWSSRRAGHPASTAAPRTMACRPARLSARLSK
ncbi:hypothetical protein [Paractinoplanes durhamensis]|uniref:hypothetical protein n=1 Tax=Paractinoplanes durhamensis TaxID=113563 RepID=UPI0036391B45